MRAKLHVRRAAARSRQAGLSLIELMVALTIGSLLIAGTVFVYIQSRNSYGVNETVARLQETARYALSVIEPDVRMSNYWGLVNDPEMVQFRARQTDPVAPIAPGAAATTSPSTCTRRSRVRTTATRSPAPPGRAVPPARHLTRSLSGARPAPRPRRRPDS
jgi:type IV pilus assembly protein PilW